LVNIYEEIKTVAGYSTKLATEFELQFALFVTRQPKRLQAIFCNCFSEPNYIIFVLCIVVVCLRFMYIIFETRNISLNQLQKFPHARIVG